MTKEERAIKWFSKVDQNQEIDLKTKMKICDMAAMIMLLIIFLVLAIELSLLVGLGGIDVINAATDFLNSISQGRHTKMTRISVIIAGGLICLHLFILPIGLAIIFRNKLIRFQINKIK